MPVQTVRPDATNSGGSNYTITGAVSTHQDATNDNSDSTWIRKTGSGTASIILGLQNFALSSTQTVKQVRLRARCATPTTAGKLNVQLGTRSGGQNYFAPALQVRGLRTIQTFTDAWQSAAPDGGSWTQAKIDALRIQVTDYRDSADRAFTYELFADIDIANAPTVTVNSPNIAIAVNTAKPDVTWTYSDIDGDGQAYYQIRVVASGVYSLAGFDPETSTAVWDSGVIGSTDSSVTITDYLLNGTYRAYMRVAKTINGAPFWSAWAFSEFNVSLTPPTTPTLTSSYSTVNARTTLTIDGVASGTFDYQVFELQRSDNGGTTFTTVRNGADITPGLNFDSTFFDFEAPRGISARYRVRAIGYLGDNVIASAWSASSIVTITNDSAWWLKAIAAPTLNTGAVRVLAGIGQTIEEDLGVFRPMGRNRALVVAGSIYGADGSYRIATSTTNEWNAIYALATHQGTILVQDPFGGQKYIRIVSRSWEEEGAINALRRTITLGYVEVS